MDDRESPSTTEVVAETGGKIPWSGDPAYRMWREAEPRFPILIAVPHAGRSYPEEVAQSMRRADEVQRRLEDRFVDLLAYRIAEATGASLLVADAPRALIDLNRSVDDVDWGLVEGPAPNRPRNSLVNRRSRHGLGLVPRRMSGIGELWKTKIKREELDARVSGIFRPYHAALGRELDRIRDRWGAALLIDLHSMPPLRPTGANQFAAEFVIGDRFGASSDHSLVDLTQTYLTQKGRRVSSNNPYSGGYILDRFGQRPRGIHAVQIEVCRSLYLDSRLDQPSARLPSMARLLTGLVRALAPAVTELGEPSRARAAE